MVRSRDDHCIQVLRLVDHLAEVAVLSRLWVFLRGLSEVPFVHVAQRGDVFALHLVHVLSAAAVDANEAEVELVAGRSRLCQTGGRPKPDPRRGDQKLAPRILCHSVLPLLTIRVTASLKSWRQSI